MSKIEPKVVYYAHAICIYGSETESKELRLIRARFPDAAIVNPRWHSVPLGHPDPMAFYLKLVDLAESAGRSSDEGESRSNTLHGLALGSCTRNGDAVEKQPLSGYLAKGK